MIIFQLEIKYLLLIYIILLTRMQGNICIHYMHKPDLVEFRVDPTPEVVSASNYYDKQPHLSEIISVHVDFSRHRQSNGQTIQTIPPI